MGVVGPDGLEQPSKQSGIAETDMEKNGGADPLTTEIPGSNDNGASSSDGDSERFQEGVQRVRAITTIWSKSTLISMFVL